MKFKTLIISLFILFLISCGDDGGKKTEDDSKCENITCSNHGECKVVNDEAACECESGYFASNLECINPCETIDCSGHGTCSATALESYTCSCDDGYILSGQDSCIEDYWELISESPISSRRESCSFMTPDGYFYVVGGRDATSSFSDVWRYKNSNWESVTVPQDGRVQDGGRMGYCDYDKDSNSLYMFGREIGGNAAPSDVVKWDLTQNSITLFENGETRSLRGHTVHYLSDSSIFSEPVLVIFGGVDPQLVYNGDIEIYRLESETVEFIQFDEESFLPAPRGFHSSVLTSDNKLIVIGGKNSTRTFDEVWEFDFNTMEWTRLSNETGITEGHTKTTIFDKEQNRVILYGGKDFGNDLISDMAVYDIGTGEWSLYPSDGNDPTLGTAGAIDSNGDILLFGGVTERDGDSSKLLKFKLSNGL